jgi:hypothetical protein
MLWFLNIFAEKTAKKLPFWAQYKKLSLIITLVFQKNANFFAENCPKIAKNCDRNIDSLIDHFFVCKQGSKVCLHKRRIFSCCATRRDRRHADRIGSNLVMRPGDTKSAFLSKQTLSYVVAENWRLFLSSCVAQWQSSQSIKFLGEP